MNDSKSILKCIISRKQKACSCTPSTTEAAYAASGAWRAQGRGSYALRLAGSPMGLPSYKSKVYWLRVRHSQGCVSLFMNEAPGLPELGHTAVGGRAVSTIPWGGEIDTWARYRGGWGSHGLELERFGGGGVERNGIRVILFHGYMTHLPAWHLQDIRSLQRFGERPNNHCMGPPPAMPTLLQDYCTTTAQGTPLPRPCLCMLYTIQHW